MKGITISILAIFASLSLYSQILIEDLNGNDLFANYRSAPSSVLASLNLKDESFKLRLILVLDKKDRDNDVSPIPEQHLFFSIKAKASDGLSTFFNKGQFSPSTNFSIGFSKMNLLNRKSPSAKRDDFFDFGSISLNYTKERLNFFLPKNDFPNQLQDGNFSGLEATISYNTMFYSKYVLSCILGYQRTNNYANLKKVDVNDSREFQSADTNVIRNVSTTKTCREGDYKEWNNYPLRITLTSLPSLSGPNGIVKLGYSVFFERNKIVDKNESNLGLVLFLAKKNEISEKNVVQDMYQSIVFSSIFEVVDIGDAQDNNLSLEKSFRITFSITIKLINL